MAAQLEGEGVDARVVKALGHPTRVRILAILRDRELASPVELAAELGLALGTVGYHVRRLEELGFIELARRTQRRGAVEHHYRARAALDDPVAAAGAAGIPRTSRGAEAVAAAGAAQAALPLGGFDAATARAARRLLTLDATARDELARALSAWGEALGQVERESAERLARAQQDAPHRCVVVLMHFPVAGE